VAWSHNCQLFSGNWNVGLGFSIFISSMKQSQVGSVTLFASLVIAIVPKTLIEVPARDDQQRPYCEQLTHH
jgi:hypothetical protein